MENFIPYKKNDVVICYMKFSDGSETEFSGRLVIILECIMPSYDPIDFFYRVLIGKNIYYMNHCCFIPMSICWKIVNKIEYAHYL